MEHFNAAVIGAGTMGETHIQAALDSPYVDRVFAVDPDEKKLDSLRAGKGIVPARWDEVLADKSIRFISIASPNKFHAAQAGEALRAGKAVLCEKPMGNTLAEARKLMQIEAETKGFLQIGFELHYSKLYQLAKAWIDDGKIGTPVNIQTRYFCCEFHRKDNWRSNSTGSFLIGEKLSHYLDLQRWFFGADFESVYSLSSAKVVPYFHHRDNHQIMTRYPDGKVGVLNFIMYFAESYHADPLRDALEKQSDDGHALTYHVCGTHGTIETDVFRRRIRRWEFSESADGLESAIAETLSYPKEEDLIWGHNVYQQDLHVLETFAAGRPSEMSARDAYETMKLCFAAEMSEDSGKIVAHDDEALNGKER